MSKKLLQSSYFSIIKKFISIKNRMEISKVSLYLILLERVVNVSPLFSPFLSPGSPG